MVYIFALNIYLSSNQGTAKYKSPAVLWETLALVSLNFVWMQNFS